MQYRQFLKDSKDLITTYEQIRAGFVSLALERNRKATPFVEEARALKTIANTVKHPRDLLEIESLKTALLTAAGISGKASNYLQESDKIEAIVENMAQEIWQQLEKRTLNNAANLTKPDQITAICTWLIDL